MAREIFFERRRLDFASGPTSAGGQPLGACEHVVGDGYDCFHTRSRTTSRGRRLRGSGQGFARSRNFPEFGPELFHEVAPRKHVASVSPVPDLPHMRRRPAWVAGPSGHGDGGWRAGLKDRAAAPGLPVCVGPSPLVAGPAVVSVSTGSEPSSVQIADPALMPLNPFPSTVLFPIRDTSTLHRDVTGDQDRDDPSAR